MDYTEETFLQLQINVNGVYTYDKEVKLGRKVKTMVKHVNRLFDMATRSGLPTEVAKLLRKKPHQCEYNGKVYEAFLTKEWPWTNETKIVW